MNKLIRSMPFNRVVCIRLTHIHRDGITIECKLRPQLLNGSGVLHGGVTATLADAAVGIAIVQRKGLGSATTVEMKLNYLRPVSSGKVTARARLLRMGSRLCIGRVDIFDDARSLVSSALVTYMLLK